MTEVHTRRDLGEFVGCFWYCPENTLPQWNSECLFLTQGGDYYAGRYLIDGNFESNGAVFIGETVTHWTYYPPRPASAL